MTDSMQCNSGGCNISGHLVLVVDDNFRIRTYIKTIPQKAGALVLEAGDGLEALELFQSWRGRIELVVTDLRMPHMTGRDLAIALRAASPAIPLVFVSGEPALLDDHEDRDGSLFIEKPFAPDVLLHAASRFFSTVPPIC